DGIRDRNVTGVQTCALPISSPIEGANLTDTWGAARSGGRSHEGIDIFAARNTPIHSTTPGIVRKVGTNELGGNVVMILGPGAVRSEERRVGKECRGGGWWGW